MPARRPRHPRRRLGGFTLLEALVVIAVIGILAGILLPMVTISRDSAMAVQCIANLRSVGQAFQAYMVDDEGVFPLAYRFNCNNYYPAPGITHWSCLISGNNQTTSKALQCPSFDRGGLCPTDTTADNLDPGLSTNAPTVDEQPARCAFTVNEALCPQPFFQADPPAKSPMSMSHYVGSTNVDLHTGRLYQFVRIAEVTSPSSTILATEWQRNWRIVAGPGYSGVPMVSLSYRPVHGFAPVAGNSLDAYDVSLVSASGNGSPQLRRLTLGDISLNPSAPGWGQPRLNWLGRNHHDNKLTSFLYVDGHVELKSIEQTVSPFEWGDKFYSLQPGADIVSP